MAKAGSGAEIMIMDDRILAAHAVREMPSIANMNVTNSSKVHVGPKFISVNQTVQNQEMIKDLPLPKYLWRVMKNTSKVERLSCLAAITALIVFIFLIVYYTKAAKNATAEIVDVAPHPWNISREMWLAEKYISKLKTDGFDPLKLVIVQHTVSNECHLFKLCASELRNLQQYYLRNEGYDIPYNFLIGNDGRVYEGRGWNIEGAHTRGYNRCSLGIAFIGDYREELPSHSRVTQAQLDRAMLIFEDGIRRGHLAPDFRIVGASDITPSESPGSNLLNALRKLPFYDRGDRFRDKSCETIYGRT